MFIPAIINTGHRRTNQGRLHKYSNNRANFEQMCIYQIQRSPTVATGVLKTLNFNVSITKIVIFFEKICIFV